MIENHEMSVVARCVYGSVRIIPVTHLDLDGNLLFGAYSMHLDQQGNEVTRSSVTYYSKMPAGQY